MLMALFTQHCEGLLYCTCDTCVTIFLNNEALCCGELAYSLRVAGLSDSNGAFKANKIALASRQ